MNNNKKYVLAGVLLAAVLSIGAISTASAYRGDFSQNGPNYSPERHALMEKAFETNDYNLWKSQMEGRAVTNSINENNFYRFAYAHRLADEGKYDEANRVREELNLRTRDGDCSCAGMGNGMHNNRR